MDGRTQILALVSRVRARWRRLALFQAILRGGLLVAGVLAVSLTIAAWTGRWPLVLGLVGIAAAALITFVLFRTVRRLGPPPTDAKVARLIEEAEPALDDRLASAVDFLSTPSTPPPGLAGSLLADAARQTERVDPREVVPGIRLRKAGGLAAAAVLLVVAVGFLGRDVVRQSRDALSLALFPSRVSLDVLPGNARVRAGESLTIEARLVGNRAPVDVRVLRGPAGTTPDDPSIEWERLAMSRESSDGFAVSLEQVTEAFRYRVEAGSLSSPVFDVEVTRPPRVTRIDIDYTYPRSLGLEPRTDEDSGDVYAPAGTDVRLRVHVEGDAAAGRLAMDDGSAVSLGALESALAGSFTVAKDGTYRVALVDAEGVEHQASSEYFIRMLDDRPPDVRVLRPARDREVTALEEVEIEAEARDDFGLERLELVYTVGGGPEQVVPLDVPRRATAVTAGHTLYLEDLKVAAGDFVSYYVRARDVGRTARSREARSDIYFLQVRPFEQQFRMADSQAQGAAGGNRTIDDLVAAQKEIIVATFKLDRRAGAADDAAPEQDVRAVARAEAEVKTRVEATSSALGAGALRDPRRPARPGAPAAGTALPGQDAMAAAAAALGRAVEALEALKTADALPAEMEALDHLLEAQADVQERQVARQQAGAGGNRSNQDLSGLFDRELQREQRTNYENRQSAQAQEPEEEQDLLERVRDLARRQDELLREQRELDRMREQMADAERQRSLERLSREQQELREQAEQLARELNQGEQAGRAGEAGQAGRTGEAGQRGDVPSGQPGQQAGQRGRPGEAGQRQAGQTGRAGQTGNAGDAGAPVSDSAQGAQDGGSTPGDRLRAAAESMRGAADGNPADAAERRARALEELRQAERELQASTPEGQQRALGNLQFEARELADAQRALGQAGQEAGRAGRAGQEAGQAGQAGQTGGDQARRLAGEQERLAERVDRLREELEQQGTAGAAGGAQGSREAAADLQDAARDAAQEIERQRLVERMQEAADSLRAGAEGVQSASASGADQQSASNEIARALDALADRLAAATGSSDAESRRLSSQLARAQELREQMAEVTRELERLDRQAQQSDAPGGSTGAARQAMERQLEQTQALLEELQRDDPGLTPNGTGFTFEGQGMVTSAPGTEAFKQDLSRWEELRRQVSQLLDRAETSVAARLRARQSQDRLASGLDDRAPAAYQQHVDSYFKALADRSSR